MDIKKLIFIPDKDDTEALRVLSQIVCRVIGKQTFGTTDLSDSQVAEVKKRFAVVLSKNFRENPEKFTKGSYINLFMGQTADAIGLKKQQRFHFDGQQYSYTVPSLSRFPLWFRFFGDPIIINERLRFENQIKRALELSEGCVPLETPTQVVMVKTLEQLDSLIAYVKQTGINYFDFETFPKTPGLKKAPDIADASLDFNLSLPTVLGISFQPGSSYIIPLYHPESWFLGTPLEDRARYNGSVIDEFLDKEQIIKNNLVPDILNKVIDKLEEVFCDPSVKKIAHNFHFDYKVLRSLGITPEGEFHDTLMQKHTLREDLPKDLKSLASTYFPEFSGYGDDIDYANEPLESLSEYCAKDNDLGIRMWFILMEELRNDPLLYRVYWSLEVPKLKVLSEMEYRGMLIDREYLYEALEHAQRIQQEVYREVMDFPVIQNFTLWKRQQKAQEEIEILKGKIDAWITKKEQELKDKIPKEYLTKTAKEIAEVLMTLTGDKLKKGKEHLANHTKLIELQQAVLRGINNGFPYSQPLKWQEQINKITAGDHNLFDKINFESPDQLGELIYTSPVGLKFPMPETVKKRKNKTTGLYETIRLQNPSTNKDDLSYLKDDTGLLEKIQEYRLVTKVISQYLEGMLKLMDNNNCIHSSFRTVTSQRLGSSRPNLQNIISRTKLKSMTEVVDSIKKMFVAPSGDYTFYQIDLSQAELRFIAETWRIKRMIQGYAAGEDIHIITSAFDNNMTVEEMMLLPKEVFKQRRFEGKGSNFGLMYETSAKGFQQYAWTSYGIKYTDKEAERRHKNFYKLYDGVIEAHSRQKKICLRDGFVRTVFGSKRHIPDIESGDNSKRSHAGRVAINSPIQGSSGQWMVFSLVVFRDYNVILKLDGNDTNTVHDSAIGYVHNNDKNDYLYCHRIAMEQPPTKLYFGWEFKEVSMIADIETGQNWKELKKYEI